MLEQKDTPQARIDHWLELEREAMDLATKASEPQIRDMQFAVAEKCADEAWSIAEQSDLPFIPSSIWTVGSCPASQDAVKERKTNR